jgi:hypothetical protein
MDTNVLMLSLAVIVVVFRVLDPLVLRLLGPDK